MPDTQTRLPLELDASSENWEYLRVLLAGIFEEEPALYLAATDLGLFVACDIRSLTEEPGIFWNSFTSIGEGLPAADIKTRIRSVFRELTLEKKRNMNPDAPTHGDKLAGFRITSGMWKDTLVLRVIPASGRDLDQEWEDGAGRREIDSRHPLPGG